MGVAHHTAPYSPKESPVRAQAAFGWSQIMSLLTSIVSQSCQKLTDIIKNNDISELHHPLEKVWNYCTIYSIAHTHSCTLYVHQGWIYKFLDGEGYTLTAAGCLQPAKLGQCPPQKHFEIRILNCFIFDIKVKHTKKRSSLLSVLVLIPRPSLPCPPQTPN